MYHALDRVHQRAVLQEQPHVSNFIGGKAGAAPTKESSSGGGGGSIGGAGATTMPPPPACVGGGGGQRPAGVTFTQAQQRNLLRWRMEKEKEREKQQREMVALQQRRATAALGASMSAPSSPTKTAFSSSYSYPHAVAVGAAAGTATVASSNGGSDAAAAAGNASGGGGEKGRFGVMSGIQSPRAGLLIRCGGGGGILASAPGSAPGSAGSRVSNVLCSEGLRRAAKLALRKHNLLSPTMKKLLQEEVNRLPACVAAVGVVAAGDSGRDGGEESSGGSMSHPAAKKLFSEAPVEGGDTAVDSKEVLGGSPLVSSCSQESQGSGDEERVGVIGGMAVTPAELRQSMAGDDKVRADDPAGVMFEEGEGGEGAVTSPHVFGCGGLDGAEEDDYLIQLSSGSDGSSPDYDGVEADGRGAGDLVHTTRVLFTDDDGEEGDGNGNGERDENREGGGSNLGDNNNSDETTGPLSTQSPSSLPRISSLASSCSSSSNGPILSPSQEDAGRRAAASNVVSSVGSATEHHQSQSAEKGVLDPLPSTATAILMPLGDGDKTPKRQGILESSGTGTPGGNTTATRQVRFSKTMDDYSVAGSLVSPCNSDGKDGRSLLRGFSAAAAAAAPTTESGGGTPSSSPTRRQTAMPSPRSSSSWWRSALTNVVLVASTLGAFAVLSTVVLYVGLPDHGVGRTPSYTLSGVTSAPKATAAAAAGSKTVSGASFPWALPPPLEKFMPASVLRWFVDDDGDNPAPGLWSVAVGRAAAAGWGDSTAPAGDEVPVVPVEKNAADHPVVAEAAAESTSSSSVAQPKSNADANTVIGVTKEQKVHEATTITAEGLSRTDTEEVTDADAEQVAAASAAEVEALVAATMDATAAATAADVPSESNECASVGAAEGSCEATTVTHEAPADVVQVGSRDEADGHHDTENTDAAVASAPAEQTETAAEEEEAEAVKSVPGPSESSGDDVTMGTATESTTVTTTITTIPSRSHHRPREPPQPQRRHHQAHEAPSARKEDDREVETAAAASATASSGLGKGTTLDSSFPTTTGDASPGFRAETKSDSTFSSSGLGTEIKSDSSASGLGTEKKTDSTTTGQDSVGGGDDSSSFSMTKAETTVRTTTTTTTTATPAGSYHRVRESPTQVRRSRATTAKNSSGKQPAAAASASGWGWVEVWSAVAGAVALLVGAVWAASGNRDRERADTFWSELGAGSTGGDDEPATPEKSGDGQGERSGGGGGGGDVYLF